jgi:hypothetical protein
MPSPEADRASQSALPDAVDDQQKQLLDHLVGGNEKSLERVRSAALPMAAASVRVLRIRVSRLLRGGRQELVVDQGLQRVAERILGVNRLCEPSLAQLDGAHEGPRSFPLDPHDAALVSWS